MRKTTLAFAFSIAFLANLSAQQLYYTVKFPDDRTVISCGGYPDTSDVPVIQQFSNCNFNAGVSVNDQVFNTNDNGGCKKILRTWRLIWWCDYNPNWTTPTYILNPTSTDVGPTVNGDSQNHGFLEYVQIIKVVDNVPPVFLNCPAAPVRFCDYTNNDPAQYGNRCEGPIDLNVQVTDSCSGNDITLTYRLYLDLDGNGSMETYRISSAPDAWPIEKTVSGNIVSAKIKLPPGVGLPYGRHKVEWIANDGCGNQSLCKYEFDVIDCKAPTVVCLNGLSVNIMPTGMITFWATDFLHYMEDNCTPNSLLKVAIRKSGTGTGFPAFQTSVTFDCNEVGQNFVEIWVEDAYGNAAYCETYLIVQDHFGACTTPGPVTGNISTEAHEALPGASVSLKNNLQANQQAVSAATGQDGNFFFASAPGTCNYSIVPSLDTLPLLGVNTLDVLLASRHLSGQELLPSPYRIIAADANRDGELNQTDLDVISDLIVGAGTQFPGNTAWRFVPVSHTFADPLNPLANLFPEKISTVCPLATNANQHFVAIKTADLDLSADVQNSLAGSLDDRGAGDGEVLFRAPNQRFEPGNEVTVTVTSPELSSILGFQFTLGADAQMLELLEVTPELNARLATHLAQNKIAMSWYTKPGEDFGERPVVTLKFKALQSGNLKQALFLNSTITKAEAYDVDRQPLTAALQVYRTLSLIPNAKLDPITPNPATGPVTASFHLPEACEVTLSLSDLNGTVISTQSASYEAGSHQVIMPVGARLGGMYSLRLETRFGVESQRVVVQR